MIESSDRWAKAAPDDGRTVGVTTKEGVATQRLTRRAAVSYLTVWANDGADEQEARSAQARAVAQGEIIWPASDLVLTVRPGETVVGTVSAAAGSNLRIVRLDPGERITSDPSHTPPDLSLLDNGFIDRKPPRGIDLTYAVYSEAVLPNGQRRTSEAYVSEAVRVDAEPVRVELQATENTDNRGTWDLSWADPGFGRVEVYLTDEPVPPGLSEGVLSREAVERNGLTATHLVPPATVSDNGRVVLKECQVDGRWVRSYFTAVHVVGDQVLRVGPSVSQVRPTAPRAVRLIERVDSEILTFDWPRGVSMVEVYQAARNQTVFDESSPGGSIASIDSPEAYLRRGGMLLQGLPAIGCTLHVVGVIYDGGRAIRSAPATIDYPGLVKLSYRLHPARADGAPVTPAAPANSLKVLLKSKPDLPMVHVVAVANAQRLPLFPADGDQLGDAMVALEEDKAGVAFELPLRTTPACVRVFIDDAALADRVAVIDPPLYQMWKPVLG